MPIDYKKLKINANYVLILPDPELETIQYKGRETGLYSSNFKYENGEKIEIKQKNASVFGTVYAVPSKLNFFLSEIRELAERNTLFVNQEGEKVPVNISVHRELGELTKNSVLFNVPIEIEKGDRVNFSYQAHKVAKDDKMIIETELGDMYLIKYDMLYMTVDENLNPKRMLNGYTLVEPEHIEIPKGAEQDTIKLESGLLLLSPKERLKKAKKAIIGNVKLWGTYCRGYLQQQERSDFRDTIENDVKVMYDPRLCQKLEFEEHQIMSEKTLHLVQRKDISIIFDKNFDFSKFSLTKRKQYA